jgi:predicted transcriptional regulator of viral defense system
MKRSFQECQALLFTAAESQGGYFTAKQAEEAGFDRTNHAYHVRAGNWQREHRGIYRLTHYPVSEQSDLILWSLWSRDRNDVPQGAYSHQTALGIYELSDLMPAKLHMTVPRKFRKSSKIPAVLVLHFADLPSADIQDREGYRVTRPMRTILDLSDTRDIPDDLLAQAFHEARERGLITETEIRENLEKLPAHLRQGKAVKSR